MKIFGSFILIFVVIIATGKHLGYSIKNEVQTQQNILFYMYLERLISFQVSFLFILGQSEKSVDGFQCYICNSVNGDSWCDDKKAIEDRGGITQCPLGKCFSNIGCKLIKPIKMGTTTRGTFTIYIL